ncbi:MAG: sensor domain-containing diguanylate cyclase [Aeromonas sp.]|uniref:sensor domain-containing diguanylate cyclase n=2 Tax=Aeromonas sp. TaxID=647 RepID=UPI002FC72F40
MSLSTALPPLQVQAMIRDLKEGRFAPRQPLCDDLASDPLMVELNELADSLDRRFRELHRLQEIAAEVSKGLFIEDTLTLIYDTFAEFIPYDRIGCALLCDDGIRVRSFWSKSRIKQLPGLKEGYRAKLTGSSLAQILATGEPRIINDLEVYLAEHPRSLSTRLVLREGVRSSLTCPLQVDGKGIGFLFFSSASKHTYQKLHQEVFVYLARLVSSIIEKAQLYRQVHELNAQLEAALAELKERSCRDALTGALNRGAIMEHFEQQMQLAKRRGEPLCLIMLDLDHFKQINDTHGHPAGDHVLQQLVQALTAELRESDRLGRYGGEEFILLLGESDLVEGARVAERLRARVAAMGIVLEGQGVPVTISLGVSGVLPMGAAYPACAELLAQADRALYQAKRTGRNRVCLFEG